jgi:single-strand DNA-binding protein
MTGRLVVDPELRHTGNETPVTSFRIAVRRDFAQKGNDNATDFFNVVAWRATAEFVCNYFKKGSMIQVVGHMENREWEDKQGQARVTAELVADKVYFGEGKGKDTGEDAGKDSGPFGAAGANDYTQDVDPFA